MTTGKTVALTRQTFVGKVMSLLFSMLSRLVITFLPRSKRLLISWLQSPSALIFHIRLSKYCSFSFSIHPSNECSALISFRVDLFGLLAVQGTLKSLLQHPSSKALILQCSTFFIVQLSHPYMSTRKSIALTEEL